MILPDEAVLASKMWIVNADWRTSIMTDGYRLTAEATFPTDVAEQLVIPFLEAVLDSPRGGRYLVAWDAGGGACTIRALAYEIEALLRQFAEAGIGAGEVLPPHGRTDYKARILGEKMAALPFPPGEKSGRGVA